MEEPHNNVSDSLSKIGGFIKKIKILSPTRLLFSEVQQKILKECKIANKEDNFQWLTKNVAWPVLIIIFPLFLQFVFPTTVKDFKTLIFNGSISLIGINILFGMSTYLIKVSRIEKNRTREIQGEQENFAEEKVNNMLNQDVIHLRSRLDDYKTILVFIGGAFYVVQALFGKYNSEYLFYSFMGCTILILVLSIMIGRYMFIIKDDFFEKTFYGEYNETVIQARNRLSQKY